ncbi:MAG: hypothetical protein NTZ09_00305 [Candidatus Hydrogenedentes bacterium]|nr:hypothetical protein [Candidatus Hydrogenedentota bacterium]
MAVIVGRPILARLPVAAAKIAILPVTALSIVALLWNTYQEGEFLGRSAVIEVIALWSIFPVAAMAVCRASKRAGWTRGSFVYSLFILLVYAAYALNGASSSHGEGVQHMHVILVPLFLLILTAMLFLCIRVRFRSILP